MTSAFDSLGLDSSLLRAVHDLGYVRPTPIQEKAIPVVLEGRDFIGVAQTGTGKTAAFVLPAMHRILPERRGRTRVLVLCPTRELARQVEEDVRDLGRHTRFHTVVVYGGTPFGQQTKSLRGGADFVVATPGRLLDHMGRGNVDFSGLKILVLDEADRMLDMGFLPDIKRIVRVLPRDRQTMLFSATMPAPIVALAREVLHDAVQMNVNPQAAAPMAITHAVYPVNQAQKTDLLLEILRRTTMPSVLIFTRTRRRADRLVRAVREGGYRTEVLHGDRSQRERDRALASFKEGRVQVLIATDIASRGLDIEDISHVINYDVPEEPEVYIHRIGRTARAEALGEAFTLAAPEEEPLIDSIEGKLGRDLPRVTLPHFNYQVPTVAVKRGGGLVGSRPRTAFERWPKRFGRRR